MKLLLLISALLTGITGAMSGGRQAESLHVELTASIHAAEVAVQVAQASPWLAPAFAMALMLAIALFIRPLTRWRVASPSMPRRRAPRTERRLE